ncbi:MAG: site-specific integrase [Candidatus Micrarchaeia archaeon]
MAYLVNKNGCWYGVFSIGKKRKWIKIGKCPKGEAKRILQNLELQRIQRKFNLTEEKVISFSEFAEKYLSMCKLEKAPKTFWREEGIVKNHLIPFFRDIVLSKITPELIEEYKISRKNSLKSPKARTINLELLTLSALFRKAVEMGYLRESPMKKVKMLKERDSKTIRFLSVEEIQKLKASCSPWLYPFIVLLLNTGMRLSEARALMWEQVDFERRVIRLTNREDFQLKNLTPREIPINDELYEVLVHLRDWYPLPYWNKFSKQSPYVKRQAHQMKYLFCDPEGNMVKSFRKSFERAVKRAGISGATIHSLRHTFASHLIMAGVDVKTVQTLLGHKTITVTIDTYGHLPQEHVKQAINKLPWLGIKHLSEKPALYCVNGRRR